MPLVTLPKTTCFPVEKEDEEEEEENDDDDDGGGGKNWETQTQLR